MDGDNMIRVIECWSRHETVNEYDNIDDAMRYFTDRQATLPDGHVLYLVGPDDTIRYPPISKSETFAARALYGGSGGAIRVMIPARVRDRMDIRADDLLTVQVTKTDE